MRGAGKLALGLLAASQGATGAATRIPPWHALAAIPIGTLQEHSTVAVSDTKLVVLGGLLSNRSTTNQVLVYDIPTNAWSTAAPLPVVLNHPNAAAVAGKAYVLSGLTAPGPNATGAWRAVPDCAVYDPAANTWTALPPLPAAQARGGAAVGVHGATIFIAGGIAGSGGASVATVSAFDTAAGRWLELPAAARQLPAPRDHVGGAVVAGKFYVLGGRDSGVTNVKDTVFVLDLADLVGGWRTGAARMPTARGGVAAAAVGSKIYVLGGEGNRAENTKGVFGQTEVYDVVADRWESLGAMHLPRHGTCAAVAEGRIYIPGGGVRQGEGATSEFDVFTP